MSGALSISSVFLSAFLAATFIPFSSEAVFVALAKASNFYELLFWATFGNTLGGMTNYYIARFAKFSWAKKYLRIKDEDTQQANKYIDLYGGVMAFFSFLPIIGEPLAFVLGLRGYNQFKVITFMVLGKGLRYYFLCKIFL